MAAPNMSCNRQERACHRFIRAGHRCHRGRNLEAVDGKHPMNKGLIPFCMYMIDDTDDNRRLKLT